MLIGADECGTGSLISMLVVCGVRAPVDWSFPGLNDSKKLSPKRREGLASQLGKLIAEGRMGWALVQRSNEVIDRVGMGVALKDAYMEVFSQLYQEGDEIIVDGNMSFGEAGAKYNVRSMIKADGTIPQVMAASVLGKVYRDGRMRQLHQSYPDYNWAKNKGYPSPDHLQAIQKLGYTPLHRMSYKIKGIS